MPEIRRGVVCLCFSAMWIVLFRLPVGAFLSLAFHDQRYTSTLLIPLLSAGLLWIHRRTIFLDCEYDLRAGAVVALPGLILVALAPSKYVLSVQILALASAVAGTFVGCYGRRVARRAIFPLMLLILMVPIPAESLDRVVLVLQTASSEAAYRLFVLFGIPVLRESAFKFSLPGVSIEVAEQCSGIRSSLSLFICVLCAGYLLLRSAWTRTVLATLTIPIVIVKNAVRIATISWLGVYVDPGFLHGRLHRYSGLPFSLLALALLIPLLAFFRRVERGEIRPACSDRVAQLSS